MIWRGNIPQTGVQCGKRSTATVSLFFAGGARAILPSPGIEVRHGQVSPMLPSFIRAPDGIVRIKLGDLFK
jgi:hypothetical protein